MFEKRVNCTLLLDQIRLTGCLAWAAREGMHLAPLACLWEAETA